MVFLFWTFFQHVHHCIHACDVSSCALVSCAMYIHTAIQCAVNFLSLWTRSGYVRASLGACSGVLSTNVRWQRLTRVSTGCPIAVGSTMSDHHASWRRVHRIIERCFPHGAATLHPRGLSRERWSQRWCRCWCRCWCWRWRWHRGAHPGLSVAAWSFEGVPSCWRVGAATCHRS